MIRTLFKGETRDVEKIHGTLLGGVSLGNIPPRKPIGWTVSIPTRHCVPVVAKFNERKARKAKLRWEYLTPTQQCDYLLNTYIKTIVSPYVESLLGVFELNKNGHVHLHMICYGIDNDYQLSALRSKVRQEPLAIQMVGHNMTKHKHLNFIHFLEDVPKWIQYMQKDIDKNPLPVYLEMGSTKPSEEQGPVLAPI